MSTVQSQLLKLSLKVDPSIKSTGALFTSGTIGTVAGDKFSAQGLLDIYNDARFLFVEALNGDPDLRKKLGSTVKRAALTWAASGSVWSAGKPTDYIGFIDMFSSTGIPMLLTDGELASTVMAGSNSYYAQSASIINIFDEEAYFVRYSVAYTGGATLRYYGLTTYTLANVTGGAVTESFELGLQPHLIEVAAAMANGVGSADAVQLAKTLTGRK